MNAPMTPKFVETDLDSISDFDGKVAVFMSPTGQIGLPARRVNKLMKRSLIRLSESKTFDDMPNAGCHVMSMPNGMAASAVIVIKMPKRVTIDDARAAGASLAKIAAGDDVLLLTGTGKRASEIAFAFTLRQYEFHDHKTSDAIGAGQLTVMANDAAEAETDYADKGAIAEGVFFTRDLVNEPANILTTKEFAKRLHDLEAHGLKVKTLEEADMEKLGMHSLLGVGQGSESPSKIVIMEWNGGGDEQPFALVGKGVVFDTGGISLKPAGGMEDMTMDMGGAGVVAGVMKTLAMRKAKANVVGLVGLVENMPDANAQRPGDVVKSMKGDTIEVINTDAEGRLVLADVLWYAQETYKPTGVIDLATLTGAIIIGLGHENAGVFSNNDELSRKFLNAANIEREGAWRMPLGDAYDKLIKSRIADIKNVGGRAAGSITAAQFLQRFIKEDMPWIHLDIAGVASVKTETDFAPKGATGWGVRALDRYIADNHEAE
ncbi:leucyl aminopeptidase [Amylibacter sp. SFDW26]|uniref:leucyl aminopeptidase n=1 Tax=Amylibacter sp. SFDW26 TaxID=2652722 RepID=UPI0012621930|nr:leucyl aminopeptidase [Amylibacter sp. SFDW26]KAB7615822.1 leucyl aminopeptidase [Amylibacter sp. SFDW26]